MRRFSLPFKNTNYHTFFRCCSSSSPTPPNAKNNFQYHFGRAAGILVPFAAVWFGSKMFFAPSEQQQQIQEENFVGGTPPEGEVTIIQPANGKSNGASLGGPFEMIDCSTKQIVTDKEVFSNNNNNNSNNNKTKWSLLYFGFTKCAEVCPRNLKFMTDVLELLQKNTATSSFADDVQIVFVSVDPIRDSPDVLDKYLKEKVPQNIHWKGLCGSQEQVSHTCQVWRVYYSSMNESEEERIAREAKGMSLEEAIGSNNENYQLDHSAAVYFIAPGGRLRDLFFDEMGAKHAADRIDLHLSGAYSGLNAV